MLLTCTLASHQRHLPRFYDLHPSGWGKVSRPYKTTGIIVAYYNVFKSLDGKTEYSGLKSLEPFRVLNRLTVPSDDTWRSRVTFRPCPQFSALKGQNVSERGSLSILRWKRGEAIITYPNWNNTVGASFIFYLRMERGPVPETLRSLRALNIGQVHKSSKTELKFHFHSEIFKHF